MPARTHFRPFRPGWFNLPHPGKASQAPAHKGPGNKGGNASDYEADPRSTSENITLTHMHDLEVLAEITSGPEAQMQWLLEISKFRINIAYLPKNAVMSDFDRGTMFKVVKGKISMQQNPNTSPVIVENCIYQFGLRDMTIRTDDNMITAMEETVMMVIEPLFDTSMEDFPVVTDKDTCNSTIAHPVISGLPDMKFTEYADMGFYNLTGFQFNLDGVKLAHQQYWLADKGINCGIHDHSDLLGKDAFCEIHSCVINGTGYGGMFRSELPLGTPMDQITQEDMTRLAVPSGHEHGPFWESDVNGKPAYRADGSIIYRPHAWIAGNGDPRTANVTSMDFWIATEMEPEIVRNMLE